MGENGLLFGKGKRVRALSARVVVLASTGTIAAPVGPPTPFRCQSNGKDIRIGPPPPPSLRFYFSPFFFFIFSVRIRFLLSRDWIAGRISFVTIVELFLLLLSGFLFRQVPEGCDGAEATSSSWHSVNFAPSSSAVAVLSFSAGSWISDVPQHAFQCLSFPGKGSFFVLCVETIPFSYHFGNQLHN